MRNWTLQAHANGLTTCWLNVPDKKINVLTAEVLEELDEVLHELESNDDVRVVIFRSSKSTGFLAGADITQFCSIKTEEEARAVVQWGQNLFQRIANLDATTVAVIHGPCLGGGLELALACDMRIALDDPSTKLGLPETRLGILPAWGGTQRLPKRIGIVEALDIILKGKDVSASKAHRLGLVDKTFQKGMNDETLLTMINDLAKTGATPPRRSLWWKFLNYTELGPNLVVQQARKQVAKENGYPALEKVISAVDLAFDDAPPDGFKYEADAFSHLIFTDTCRNLVGLFLQRERARQQETWSAAMLPKTEEAIEVGVVGAGTMGAGIIQWLLTRGLRVHVKEVDDQAIASGQQRVRKLVNDAVSKRVITSDDAEETISTKLEWSRDWKSLANCSLVIEAAFEDERIKENIVHELESVLATDAIIVTNTSALSVEKLAGQCLHPERLAGLHFFNPVHRMELVEIVRTSHTSEITLGNLVRFTRKIGKTPIVVSDSPGFVVNRILFPYLNEALRLLVDGADPARIDREVKAFGMPMGPYELMDQVGLDIAAHVAETMSVKTETTPESAAVLKFMIDQGWLGRKSKRGFYYYNKRGLKGKCVNPHMYGIHSSPPLQKELDEWNGLSVETQRLILSMVNEAAKCLEEEVCTEAWAIDLAMVLGTGFAPFRGGPLRLADTWGNRDVTVRLELLANHFGSRFQPADILTRLGKEDKLFLSSLQETSKSESRMPTTI
ncbi:3-hydroxyacyl-CoA dehydrogenase NAD-binding domain-containing protein [Calycomorphotria hydatis]|uniref:enoyl-CoA hydratase n=1 Tax=Calycomorphotria hydatis TaxID=2528027 RepID=A0A517T9E7_9PLAN|nr:3-hydroxyacyl-CoA dehydrogenase NAD-binding domain-containing protein [Calycomorphotria hydatis]QDT64997.1 Fatty acid oxidation complex subunit alpha [Calycomorphotria hydatis]